MVKEIIEEDGRRIEFDREKCIWCRSCELICSLSHEGLCSPDLSRIRISLNIFELSVECYVCKHCKNPSCLKACPFGAIRWDDKTKSYIIFEEKCTACGLCAEACPYNINKNILFFNPKRKVYVKCDLCSGNPQCVQICPSKALKYTPG
jgi:Fe-S-cluster-containing hydrogenase component 2